MAKPCTRKSDLAIRYDFHTNYDLLECVIASYFSSLCWYLRGFREESKRGREKGVDIFCLPLHGAETTDHPRNVQGNACMNNPSLKRT